MNLISAIKRKNGCRIPIHKVGDSMNKKSDVNNLSAIYTYLLNKIICNHGIRSERRTRNAGPDFVSSRDHETSNVSVFLKHNSAIFKKYVRAIPFLSWKTGHTHPVDL